MKVIPITSKHGLFECLVDDEDYEWLMSFKWRIIKGQNTVYAQTHVKSGTGRMHRLIYSKHGALLDEQSLDHRDRNGLNNQKTNLRICTGSQNGANIMKPDIGAVPSSRYKGVTTHDGGWYARIKVNQRYRCIAVMTDERDAAIAYDIKAKEHFGEFARLNVPEASTEDIERVMRSIANPKRVKNTTSCYLGVFWAKKNRRWGFNALYNGKNYQAVRFHSEHEAAVARDQHIREHNLPITLSLPSQ